MYSGWVSSYCSISHASRVNLVANPVISHEWGALAYGVYISQLIRYYRACGTYQDFLDRGCVLTRKLLNKGFLLVQLKSRFEILAVATMTSLTAMEYLCHNGRRICSSCGKHFPVLSMYHRLCNIVSTERYILHMQVLLECCYIWMEGSQWENWNHRFCRKLWTTIHKP
jgi:hypothetical protein